MHRITTVGKHSPCPLLANVKFLFLYNDCKISNGLTLRLNSTMPWIEVVPITNPNAIRPFKMDDVI